MNAAASNVFRSCAKAMKTDAGNLALALEKTKYYAEIQPANPNTPRGEVLLATLRRLLHVREAGSIYQAVTTNGEQLIDELGLLEGTLNH